MIQDRALPCFSVVTRWWHSEVFLVFSASSSYFSFLLFSSLSLLFYFFSSMDAPYVPFIGELLLNGQYFSSINSTPIFIMHMAKEILTFFFPMHLATHKFPFLGGSVLTTKCTTLSCNPHSYSLSFFEGPHAMHSS